jgi:uncharacterized protein YndB with AHSA1/START domain
LIPEVPVTMEVQSIPQETETAGSPNTVHVTRSVAAPVSTVWQHLISPAGTAALLGDGAHLGSKGESWRSSDGPHGVVRSYHPLEQVRVSWHADDDAPGSLVDVHLIPDGDSTRVDLVHERLTDHEPPPGLQGFWQDALERFSAVVAG